MFAEFRTAHPSRELVFRSDGNLNGLWDSDRIRQAMSNLLSNALHHGSPDFPVTLSLRAQATSVIIDVHNGGDPIPPSELLRIFDPLVRGSSANGPKSSGTGSMGMGLYIAREVAKSHNGRIDVSSTAQDGTSFTIRLPRKAAPRVGEPIPDAGHVETV